MAGRVDARHVAPGRHGQPRRELPISPRPTTTTFEPGPASAIRSACSAMAAIVVNAASRGSTPAGTGAHSRPGTTWNSAWLAFPAPPVTTSWPGLTPVTAEPASSTTPAAEYPSGTSCASRPRTVWRVTASPSERALRTSWRTRSGLARALASRLD